MRQPGQWRARMAVVLTAMVVAAGVVVSSPAQAASADETRALTLANGLRASVGAPPLVLDESLSAVARRWAAAMASAGTISHNPNLSTQVTGWMKLAENVGMGPSIDSVHQAFVASHPHYVNLTDTQVTAVGIGVVTSGATVFIVEDFLGRSGATVAPPATVASPTTPAPPSRAPVAPRVTATTAPVPPLTPGPPVPPRTPASAVAPAAATAPVAGAAPPAPPPEPSPWLALALEVTRGWERTSG